MSGQTANSMRKWLAFGTGAGLEIDGTTLRAAVVRVRPSGIQAVASHAIENFRDKPAAGWGAELSAFFTNAGAVGRPAMIVLASPDSVSRTIAMPGVPKKELASALAFEMDSLSPYGDGETASAWAPVGTDSVLTGMARPEIVAGYADLFSEAGIPVAGFTTAPAAIYSALHLVAHPSGEFLAVDVREDRVRVYGEGATTPVFWAVMDTPPERAIALSRAQLRLSETAETSEMSALLPGGTLAGAAAVMAACPWLAPSINLLPATRRTSRSPWLFAPTMALLALTAISGIALAGFRQFEDRRLMGSLNAEIAKVEPLARRTADAERVRAAAAKRIGQLQTFRERTRADLNALKEATQLIAPPAWSTNLDIVRSFIAVAGESGAAADLPKAFDASPLFKNTEFTSPLSRSQTAGMDVFRIRAEREGSPK